MDDSVIMESGKEGKNKPLKPSASIPASTLQQSIPTETGGPKGPEPTRYGDWEINGKCVDF